MFWPSLVESCFVNIPPDINKIRKICYKQFQTKFEQDFYKMKVWQSSSSCNFLFAFIGNSRDWWGRPSEGSNKFNFDVIMKIKTESTWFQSAQFIWYSKVWLSKMTLKFLRIQIIDKLKSQMTCFIDCKCKK